MMFLKESLYGWGVCDIPMPRSAHDIFSDRRKKNTEAFDHDRRKHDDLQGIFACVSGVLTHDVPWIQTSLTLVASLLCIIFVYLMSKMILEFPEVEIPEPVEIMINMIEEFDKVPPVQRTAPQREKTINEEKPAPVETPKPERKQKPAAVLKQESTFEETLPEIKIRSGIEHAPLNARLTPMPENTSFDRPIKQEEIDISVSTEKMMRYNNDNVIQKENELLPQHSRLVFEQPVEKSVLIASLQHQQRSYDQKTTNQVKVTPSVTADTFMGQSDTKAEIVTTANLPNKNYQINTTERVVTVPSERIDTLFTQKQEPVPDISHERPSRKDYNIVAPKRVVPVPSGRTDSFLTHQDSPESTITPAARTQKTYKRNLDPGNRVSKAPSIKADSFLSQPNPSAETVSPVNSSLRSYNLDVVKQNEVLTPNHMSDTKVFAPVSDSNSDEVSLSEPDQMARQYVFDAKVSSRQAPALPGATDQSQFLVSQKDGMNQDEELKININSMPALKPAQGNSTPADVPGGSHDFLDIASIDEIDPSHLISLKQLAVCPDPEEEFQLKTKLATLLGGPAKCNSGEMLYFFKYTESGYTLQVDIYNPNGEPLGDRCSVLHSAIDCVENLRAKGVNP